MKRNVLLSYFPQALHAILLSSCFCKLILDFVTVCCWMISKHASLRSTFMLERSCNSWSSRGDYFFNVQQPSSNRKGGSVIHLFLCWVERRVRVNDYWLASHRVGVRGLLTASLAEWLLLALLGMSCTTQVSGCPWQMLFASPVHYLWGAEWPLGLTANMQGDAYQFKLRGGPPRDQGM